MPAITLAWLAARVNHCIQPTSNADEAAERRARVEVRAAGAVRTGCRPPRSTARRRARRAPSDERERAPAADLRGDLRRHQEDGAADHLVDADRGEIPAAERAVQFRPLRCRCYGHGAVVS